MARAGLVLCRCPSSDRRRRAVDRYDRENVFKREFLPLEGVEVVIQPTVQAPPPADHQPSPAPRSRSLFRCIPCDCHTTLVHSPLLVFACLLSAGYFGVSLAFDLLLLAFGDLRKDNFFLVHCSDIFNAQRQTCVVEKEVAQAESAANSIHLTALILALLINNKWLKCQLTTLPKTSLCAEVAVCLLTGIMGFAAFIASTVEVSACFSCELHVNPLPVMRFDSIPSFITSLFGVIISLIWNLFFGFFIKGESPLSVLRFESFLGVITSLFLLISVAWMALGRVPWIASTKLFRGHADLTDERASTIRHLLTSRVYIGLLVGLLVDIAVVIYFGSYLHGWLASLDGWRSWLPDQLASILFSLIGEGERLVNEQVAYLSRAMAYLSQAFEFLSSELSNMGFDANLAAEMQDLSLWFDHWARVEGGSGEDVGAAAAGEGATGFANSTLLEPGVDMGVEFGWVMDILSQLFNQLEGGAAMGAAAAREMVSGTIDALLAHYGGTIDDYLLVLPKTTILFVLILLYVQLAVCVLASAFNGWKHLQRWRTVTKVARAQVTPAPAEGISPAQPDGLDAEHSRLLDVGSKSLISASRLPALMCSSLACGSVIIALVVSIIVTALYTWSTHGLVRRLLAPIVKVIGGFLAFLIACILSRMVLARCLFDPKQLKGGGEVWPMRRPICFAWYEAVFQVVAIAEGLWIGASRLVIAFAQAVASLLRTDRPSYSEGRIVNDVVFRSYAAVLCLERDAEASRRQAGATHFESGVLAVESDVSLKHSALWCLGWLAALIAPFLIFLLMVS